MPRIPGLATFRLAVLLGVLLSTKFLFSYELYLTKLHDQVAPQLAAQLGAELRGIRASLGTLTAERQAQWLIRFNTEANIHLQLLPKSSYAVQDDPPPNMFFQTLREDLRKDFGDDLRLSFDPASGSKVLQLDFNADGQRYRLSLPGDGIQQEVIWPFGIALIANAAVVLIGVAFGIWQIKKPLQRAAAALAQNSNDLTEIHMSGSVPQEFRVFTERFNVLVRRLKAQERERALLLAGVSHDLRAPLTRMRIRAELINDDEPAIGGGLVNDADSMRRIIDQFLDYQRTIVQSTLTIIDLGCAAKDVVARYHQSGRPVDFRHEGETRVEADPVAVQRILDNLIDNAFAHGSEPVGLCVRRDQSDVIVEVRDHGKGIDEADVERLLNPFERSDWARHAQGHCGLGLSIVRRLVNELRGSLRLSNHPEGGLMVSVRLAAFQ